VLKTLLYPSVTYSLQKGYNGEFVSVHPSICIFHFLNYATNLNHTWYFRGPTLQVISTTLFLSLTSPPQPLIWIELKTNFIIFLKKPNCTTHTTAHESKRGFQSNLALENEKSYKCEKTKHFTRTNHKQYKTLNILLWVV
jgi:hypothetical protein